MKPIFYSVIAAACAVSSLAGCAMPTTTPTVSEAAAADQNVILTGQVIFPEDEGYRVMATASDVGVRASVSLIEPGGAVRAGGVTDAFGNFTLYQSTERFNPSLNGVYTLEIAKRIGSEGQLLSLRTKLMWNGTTWQSISGSAILVNLLTTAVAELQAKLGDAELTPAQIMGVAPGGEIKVGFGAGARYDAAYMRGETAALRAKLKADIDPINLAQGLDYPRSLLINEPEDLEILARVGRIHGSLVISWDKEAFGELRLSAPLLKQVDGTVAILPAGFGNFRRPTLKKGEPGSDGVVSLEGLGSLKTIGRHLVVLRTAELTSLKGLEGVRNLGGAALIAGNVALTSLSGLEGLEQMAPVNTGRAYTLAAGEEDLDSPLETVVSTTLASINNGPNMAARRGGPSEVSGLFIFNNAMLQDASAPSKMQRLNTLVVVANKRLTALPALERTDEVVNVMVMGNQSLEALPAWSALKFNENIGFGGNQNLSQRAINALYARLGRGFECFNGNKDDDDTNCTDN